MSDKKKRRHIEKEQIVYDDKVNIKTRSVPMEVDNLFQTKQKTEFHVPPTPSAEKTNQLSSLSSPFDPDDFDIASYSPDLNEATDPDELKREENPPGLLVSFNYNTFLMELNVAVVRGQHLPEEQASSNHVVVSVVLLPEGSIQHTSRGVAPNPLFKDEFTFPMTADEMRNSRIKFNVWSIDKYSRKTPIGSHVVNLQEMFCDKDSLRLNTAEMWKTIQLTDNLTNETQNGEILTSLQYLPGAERINVTILKARDLKFEEFDKDIYVKVSAVLNGKVVKNKKTNVMRKTAMPIFNETISFELQPHSSLKLHNMCIVLSIFTYRSRGAHRRLIGRAILGDGDISIKDGAEHWNKMIETPHKAIAEWQELK
eukprot:gene16700-18394_t